MKQKLWTAGDGVGTMAANVQHHIEASGQLAALREPAIKDFEIVDGQLRRRGVSDTVSLADGTPDADTGKVNILGVMLRPESSGVGGSTLKRYAVAASTGREIQRRQHQVRGRDGKDRGNRNPDDVTAVRAIRHVLGELSGGTPDVLKGALYSRSNATANSNKARLYSTLAYVSPMQFESEWFVRQAKS